MTLIEKLEEVRTHHALIAGQRLSDAMETENLIRQMEDGEMDKPEDWEYVKACNLKGVVFDMEIARRHGVMAETAGDAVREILRCQREDADTTVCRCLMELESDRGNDTCTLCGKLFESQREAAGTADEKPDGQAENA